MGYKDAVRNLDRVTLNGLAQICTSLLPYEYRSHPWDLPYGDKNYGKIFTFEDQLNGYTAAYTDWHKGKLKRVFDTVPPDGFRGEIAVIDWGCGQGLGTLFLSEYLETKYPNCTIKEVILIEPSEIALDRAKFNLEHRDNTIRISTVNKFLDDVGELDIKLFEGRKVFHIFSNILDIQGISLKKISENLRANLGCDNYVLCVSPSYPQMRRTFDSFLQYFQHPLAWQFREIKANKDTKKDFTYYIQSLKLLANRTDSIIPYEYFPATQFRSAFVLDCVKEIPNVDFIPLSYFDVFCPYELGASINDDINPVFAVLNNIITRGLPTKPSLFVERIMSDRFGKSELCEKYGGLSYLSKLEKSEIDAITQSIFEGKLGDNKVLNQIVFTPLAIARVEKLLVEALITNRLSLEAEEWDVLVEEWDVPFAKVAFDDFSQMVNHLAALSEDYEHFDMPKINLKVISSNTYVDSPLLDDDAQFGLDDETREKVYDLVITYSSNPKEKDCSFSRYHVKNECYFCIFPATHRYAERYVYTTDRIVYKELCYKDSQGTYTDKPEDVVHLQYFLQLLFRKASFRPGQVPILSRAIQNKSVIGLLPTGGGKSLTYQIAALLQPGVSIVIDPLVSLMYDQYEGLLKSGIDFCTMINSKVEDKGKREVDMETSKCLFVFMSPERLCIYGFRQRLRNMQDNHIYFAYGVIDECHCVSEWGHDFRFSYLHLGRNLYNYVLPKKTIGLPNNISLFGLTATASFDVLADVERELSGEGAFPLDGDTVVRYENTNRLELQYNVVEIDGVDCSDKWRVYEKKNSMVADVLCGAREKLVELQKPEYLELIRKRFIERENITDTEVIQEIMERPIDVVVDENWVNNSTDAASIIFCPHRDGSLGVNNSQKKIGVANSISDRFGENRVSNYVGGDELTEQQKFLNSQTDIMVATKAFGMGIDKPNVRFTININHSGSLEGYVQEAGRAGRDRKMALSTIMFCSKVFSEQNGRTRLYENVPVDYGVHKFFYENNFIGGVFEKWVMHYLMSMSSVTRTTEGEEQTDANIPQQTVSGFLGSLLDSHIGSQNTYYISYVPNETELTWINEQLVRHELPKFKTHSDELKEGDLLRKYGKKIPAYKHGYVGYYEALQKAIYRMCCVGVIDDFTQDYFNCRFRIVATRKAEGAYFQHLKNFLCRYYTEERAELELARAKTFDGNNEIQKCLGYITEFVYSKIATKRERAMQDMEDFCLYAVHEKNRSWIEVNEDLKDHIYYYFNSKYAREDYQIETGEDFSLTKDTDHGKFSSFDIVFKYMRIVDDDVLGGTDSQVGNVKHLQGAVRLIRRALTDTNPALDMLNAFCLLFLGTGNSQVLENEMTESYVKAYKDFRERSISELPVFYSQIERLKNELQKPGRNTLDEIKLKRMLEWDMIAELELHSSWLNKFKNGYSSIKRKSDN